MSRLEPAALTMLLLWQDSGAWRGSDMGDANQRAGQFVMCVVANEGAVTVVVAGELDLCSVPRLDQLLNDLSIDGAPDVALDVTRVTFCDVQGVRALLKATETMRARGRRLVLRHPTASLRRLITVLGLDSRLLLDDETQSDEAAG